MGVVSTINALQDIHRTVSGITSAPYLAQYPASVADGDLPLVLIWPNAIDFSSPTIGALKRKDFGYSVQVLVTPVAQNTMGLGLEQTATLIDAVIDAYLTQTNIQLSTSAFINTGYGVNTSNAQPINYNGIDYRGFTITLKVLEKT